MEPFLFLCAATSQVRCLHQHLATAASASSLLRECYQKCPRGLDRIERLDKEITSESGEERKVEKRNE